MAHETPEYLDTVFKNRTDILPEIVVGSEIPVNKIDLQKGLSEYDTPGTVQQVQVKLTAKQIVDGLGGISDGRMKTINRYPDSWDSNTPTLGFDTLEYRCNNKQMYVGNNLYAYVKNTPEEELPETYTCNVYDYAKGVTLPSWLKSSNLIEGTPPEFDSSFESIVKDYNSIPVNIFKQTQLKVASQFVDGGGNVTPTNYYLYFDNMPLNLFSKVKIDEHLVCWNLQEEQWYVGGLNQSEFETRLRDRLENGMKPIELTTTNLGYLLNKDESALNIIIARYLQLPTVPAIIKWNPVCDNYEAQNLFDEDFFNYTNRLFNPYLVFNRPVE